MDDYISREAALNWLCKTCPLKGEKCLELKVCAPFDRIKATPAADVRPVVTCTKCKYNKACLLECFVRENSAIMFDEETWFCADGERRTE